MIQEKILKELAENKKNLKVGGEVFGVANSEDGMKKGKPINEIVSEMRKASNEKLIRDTDNVCFY